MQLSVQLVTYLDCKHTRGLNSTYLALVVKLIWAIIYILAIQPIYTCTFIPSQIQNSELLFLELYEISVNPNFLRTVALSLGVQANPSW